MPPRKSAVADDDKNTAPVTIVSGDSFCLANADGVFEHAEKILLNGMPVKTGGEFLLARVQYPGDRVGWHVGYFLFIKAAPNTPANHAKLAASLTSPAFDTREAAMTWLVEEIAEKFFCGHKGALAKLREWWTALKAVADGGVSIVGEKPVAEVKVSLKNRVTVEISHALLAESDSHDQAIKEILTAQAEPGPEKTLVVHSAALMAQLCADPAFGGGPAVVARYAHIPLGDIEPNPDNARRVFAEVEMAELVESIKVPGFLVHAIAVRDRGEGAVPRHRLIAGERRWRAHKILGWPVIESKIFSGPGCTDELVAELALIENLQRHDLNPMEEARGFADLKGKYGYTLEKIVARTGKAESTIRNAMRLLPLPEEVGDLVERKALSASHARALASPRWISRPEHCVALALWAVANGAGRAELEATELPAAALHFLAERALAVCVEDYRDDFDWQAAESVVMSGAGELWHLAPEQWRKEKAALDREARERSRELRDHAAERVEAGTVAKVNLRLVDLKSGKVPHVVLTGELARYEKFLPSELLSFGLDAEEREVAICLQPAAVARLRAAEARVHVEDFVQKWPALRVCATQALNATIVEAASPREKISALAKMLRQIIDVREIGLVEETEAGREQALASAAKICFPPVTTDPAILAQWQRAFGDGMPLAEIARSYRAAIEDVCGALGVPVPAAT